MTNIDKGIKLHQIRKARGFTMKEVAEEIGVSESMISKWEHGKVDMSKSKTSVIGKLCIMLGVPIDEFADLSEANSLMLQSINDISMNLDEPTQELLYAILDLSPIQKMTILQMIRAMTGGKDE